jgi:hypothetical protein
MLILILIAVLSSACLIAAMVGGGYKGFVTYCPYAFDLDYFLPGGRSDAAGAGTSDTAAVPDGIDIVGLPTEVSLQDSDLLGEVGEVTPETGIVASTTPASAVPAGPSVGGGRKGVVSAAPAVALDPADEMDFNIISLRTSGY